MSKQTDPGTHTTDYSMNRKAFLCLALFLGAGYPLLSLLNIFYISVESNVLFSGSVGANILWVFTNLFAALFFFVTFGTMIAVLCRKPTKQALPVVILSFGSLIYKYAVDLLFVYLFDGFPTGAPGFGRDLVSALFNLLPEAIEFLVIFLIARAVGGKYRSLVAVSASAAPVSAGSGGGQSVTAPIRTGGCWIVPIPCLPEHFTRRSSILPCDCFRLCSENCLLPSAADGHRPRQPTGWRSLPKYCLKLDCPLPDSSL